MSIRFTPHKLLGALFAIWWTGVVIGLLCLVIPAEAIPRVEELPEGGKAYYVQSVRDIIFPPLTVGLAFALCWVYVRYVAPRTDLQTGQSPNVPRRWIGYLAYGFLIAFAMCCGCGLALVPLGEVRRVVVGQDYASFDTVASSTRLSRAGMNGAQIGKAQIQLRGGGDATEVSLNVMSTDAGLIEIKCGRFRPGDPAMDEMIGFLEELKRDLTRRP